MLLIALDFDKALSAVHFVFRREALQDRSKAAIPKSCILLNLRFRLGLISPSPAPVRDGLAHPNNSLL